MLVYTGRRLRRGQRRLTPRLQPRPTWHRVVGLGGGLIWFVGAWVVSGFFSTASAAGGWLPTGALFLPELLLLAVTAGIGRWPTATAGAVAVALLVGTWPTGLRRRSSTGSEPSPPPRSPPASKPTAGTGTMTGSSPTATSH